MDVIFMLILDLFLEKLGVRSLDCGENCLNGIKWLLEDYIKNMSGCKGEFIVNGLRINLLMIIYGGRMLKKFVCYVELDLDEGSI